MTAKGIIPILLAIFLPLATPALATCGYCAPDGAGNEPCVPNMGSPFCCRMYVQGGTYRCEMIECVFTCPMGAEERTPSTIRSSWTVWRGFQLPTNIEVRVRSPWGGLSTIYR